MAGFSALWIIVLCLVLALVGGFGYWYISFGSRDAAAESGREEYHRIFTTKVGADANISSYPVTHSTSQHGWDWNPEHAGEPTLRRGEWHAAIHIEWHNPPSEQKLNEIFDTAREINDRSTEYNHHVFLYITEPLHQGVLRYRESLDSGTRDILQARGVLEGETYWSIAEVTSYNDKILGDGPELNLQGPTLPIGEQFERFSAYYDAGLKSGSGNGWMLRLSEQQHGLWYFRMPYSRKDDPHFQNVRDLIHQGQDFQGVIFLGGVYRVKVSANNPNIWLPEFIAAHPELPNDGTFEFEFDDATTISYGGCRNEKANEHYRYWELISRYERC
ncbi:hypothetical protein CFREI_01730 [Corynebacterium freiburgense]|nr:hypothetical protein CFREI_01730 [Corynebacterium freiburgense]